MGLEFELAGSLGAAHRKYVGRLSSNQEQIVGNYSHMFFSPYKILTYTWNASLKK